MGDQLSMSMISQGLLYIGIINSIQLVSSSARVTSAKFQKSVVRSDIERPGPIDRTPGTPGSGKNVYFTIGSEKYIKMYNSYRCFHTQQSNCVSRMQITQLPLNKVATSWLTCPST